GLGIALLIILGVAASLVVIAGIRETVRRNQLSQSAALEVRASVRSLRADYFEEGDALSRVLLDPSKREALRQALDEVDARAAEPLETAAQATQRADLRALLAQLRERDAFSDRIRDQVLVGATTDRVAATALYLEQYLPARQAHQLLIERALALAKNEVEEASNRAETKASETQLLAWVAIVVFVSF